MITVDDRLTDAFRLAMRRVAATVNVIAICHDGEAMGITATAVSSISLDPPSLLVCINQAASVHPHVEDVSHFSVNVLHRDQEAIARQFADRRLLDQRFVSGWETGLADTPRLVDAQASILCRRTDHHRFGTHSIFIGVVEDVWVRDDIDPLLYMDGRFLGAAEQI